MTNAQYSLILAASLFSITVNPLMYRLLPRLESGLQRLPWFWDRLDQHHALPPVDGKSLQQHVVIVGYGRIGKHLVDVLTSLEIPLLVIEADPDRIEELNARQIACLYGDAANSEVITHAGLKQARALVSTVPEEATAAMVVAAARDLNPGLPIVARAASLEGVDHLSQLGAHQIVHPELEGGLEMVQHTLLQLGYPLRKVYDYVESVRHDRYNTDLTSEDEYRSLRSLLRAADNVEIYWLELVDGSPLIGQTLLQADLRARTSASVVAIQRGDRIIANPKSHGVFQSGDRIGVIGEPEQIDQVRKIVAVLNSQDAQDNQDNRIH